MACPATCDVVVDHVPLAPPAPAPQGVPVLVTAPFASIWRQLNPEDARWPQTISSVVDAVPTTASVVSGLSVPIPTLPVAESKARRSTPVPSAPFQNERRPSAPVFKLHVEVPMFTVSVQRERQRVVDAPRVNCEPLLAYGPFGIIESNVEVPPETAKRRYGEVVPIPTLPPF